MDVFDVLERRRMHRSFAPDLPDPGDIDRLVWAATRAPMAGNTLVRRLVLVTDPAVLRTVRQVTPSFLADAPACLVICTDLEAVGTLMGPHGRDIVSLVDAGAAAENVALAAGTLGLGVCFVRSCTEPALREVLGLPETVRPDLIVAFGRPAPRPSATVRAPRPVVYHDRWENPYLPERP